MFSRQLTILLIVLFCCALAGCALHRHPMPKPGPVGPHQIGAVSVVNADDGFVLIDGWEMPKPGITLKALSQDGQETAVLKACPQQRPPFATADITSGTPRTGDRVFTSGTGTKPE